AQGAPRQARRGRGLDDRGPDHGAPPGARDRRHRRHQGEDRGARAGVAQGRRGGLRAGDRAGAGVRRRRRRRHVARRRGRRGRRVRGRRRGGEDPVMTDEPRVDEQEEVEESGEEDRLAALEDRLLRVAAEFDNYKKRVARERQQYVTLANEGLVKELLPILDDLERALEAAAEHSARYGVGKADASADDRLRQAYADEAQ